MRFTPNIEIYLTTLISSHIIAATKYTPIFTGV